MSVAAQYAARVEAVIAQRTRLRGPQPSTDPRANFPSDHPLFRTDPLRALEPNLAVIASYVEPDDVIVDVGGGAGRLSLPLASRCREVVNVDPSTVMLRGFAANAVRAGIANARAIEADWLAIDPPPGTFALVNHVTYFVRDIAAFIRNLERSGLRRVLITVGRPQPPSWSADLFPLVYGEPAAIVPSHVELVNVLWEMGIEPDIRMLPDPPVRYPVAATREDAIKAGIARFGADQWAHWPFEGPAAVRAREIMEARFGELFVQRDGGYAPAWITPGREILITWTPGL